jgi:hypothetical protein
VLSSVTLNQQRNNNKSPERCPSAPQASVCVSGRRLVSRVDRNLFAVPTHPLELYHAVNQSKEGVIPATTDICAWVNLGAALAVNDVTCPNGLAAKFLATESLAVRITPVP